jgi:hypothetical protein
MPHRVNSLVSMVFAGSLAAAMLLGATWAALAAEECIDKPGRDVKQAGHWYYYYDRVHHRRCWFFETSEATISPRPSAERTPAPNADSEQSWFSRFAADVAQTFSSGPKQNNISAVSPEPPQNSISSFSSEPPQNGISFTSSSVTKTASPKRPRTAKIARQEQPQMVPPPTTDGLASTEQRDQLPPQRTTEKDEKHTRQPTDAERQALFEDFLKWYRDRSIFGQP